MTLLAWLAIDPEELAPEAREARDWSSRGRQDNTRWWIPHQFLKDVRRSGRVAQGFPAYHDEREHQEALNSVRATFQAGLAWGRLPRLDKMAAEADAVWGGRLAGWPAADPGEPVYDTTLRGSLYTTQRCGASTKYYMKLGTRRRTRISGR